MLAGAKKQYFCLWLDNTSNEGISNQVIGHAKQSGDKIEMLFKFSEQINFTLHFYMTEIRTHGNGLWTGKKTGNYNLLHE